MISLLAVAKLLQLHFETMHPENGPSPFQVTDDASITAIISQDGEAAVLPEEDDDVQYVCCTVEGCEEIIPLNELESHIELHRAEERGYDDSDNESGPPSKRGKYSEEDDDSFGAKLSYNLRELEDVDVPSSESPLLDHQANAKEMWGKLLKMPGPSSKAKKVALKSESEGKRLGVSLSFLSG
jgi:hypothetical protein